MNLNFNLPAGVRLADIDPDDLGEQQDREERRYEKAEERGRDREAEAHYWAKGRGRIVE